MTTPILDLDEWESAQAQPEITVNEALRWLECFAALSVSSQALTDPPGGAAEGDRYIVATGASGEWTGHEGQIALRIGGGWSFRSAPEGAIAWLEDESLSVRYLAGAWEDVETGGGGSGEIVPQVYCLHASFDTAAPVPVSFSVPVNGDYYRWTVVGHGGPGDAVIDVRYGNLGAGVALTGANSISTILPPEIAAGDGATGSDFTGWVYGGAGPGDILQFALTSSSTFTRVDFQLDIVPT